MFIEDYNSHRVLLFMLFSSLLILKDWNSIDMKNQSQDQIQPGRMRGKPNSDVILLFSTVFIFFISIMEYF